MINIIELESDLNSDLNLKLEMTKRHKLLTENGWSNDFINNEYVAVPNSDYSGITFLKIKSITEKMFSGYVYDLEIESAGGVVTRLMQGQITVTPEVTR